MSSCESSLKAMALSFFAALTLGVPACGYQTSLEAPGPDPTAGTGGGTVTAGGVGGSAGGRVGSGGSTSASGNASFGGTGGASPAPHCTVDAEHPGYLHCGAWNGYAWTLATVTDLGSTIAPADCSTARALPFCAKGHLHSEDDAVGLLGLNVSQQPDDNHEGSLEGWTPTGTGLRYELSNPGATPLRIQIQGTRGYPDETWCADISGTVRGEVPWSAFNQACWINIPPWYDNTPLVKVMLLVPGVNGSGRDFDVCLIGLEPY